MGILNLTPDSFTDGGQFLNPAAAVRQALALEAVGAHILDIGAESTRPGFEPVPPDEELRRLLPVLERLAGKLSIPISLDTRKAAVARAAFERGASILNSVNALETPELLAFAREGSFPVVLMHGLAHALDPADPHPSRSIADWFARRLDQLALDPSRVILDPGIGFGTTRPQDAAILDSLAPLLELGYPLLIGLSRKRVVRALHPGTDPDEASACMALQAWRDGATILRLHTLEPIRRLLASP
jgi:dihydropteroate synthase